VIWRPFFKTNTDWAWAKLQDQCRLTAMTAVITFTMTASIAWAATQWYPPVMDGTSFARGLKVLAFERLKNNGRL
jgi:hypothetical protein